jgi:hypothetical protein
VGDKRDKRLPAEQYKANLIRCSFLHECNFDLLLLFLIIGMNFRIYILILWLCPEFWQWDTDIHIKFSVLTSRLISILGAYKVSVFLCMKFMLSPFEEFLEEIMNWNLLHSIPHQLWPKLTYSFVTDLWDRLKGLGTGYIKYHCGSNSEKENGFWACCDKIGDIIWFICVPEHLTSANNF